MKRALAAFAVVTVASVSAIAATQAQVPAKNEQVAQASDSERGQPDMRRGPHGRDHGREQGRRGPRGERMQMWLAQNLNAAETLIGIRADQLDAWRAYTSALIDLFTPPAPPAPPIGGPAPGGPDGAAERAFAREERMAQRIKERAAKADALIAAITTLKAKLTPDQLEKLGSVTLMPRPPMHPGWGGRGPGGHGPDGRGPEGRGPEGRGGPGWHGPMHHGPGPGGRMGGSEGPGPMGGPGEPPAAGPGDDGADMMPMMEPDDAPPAPDLPDDATQPAPAPQPG